MAGRRYVRDRLGRFASAGAGATARGGRLTRQSGSRYDTQTRSIGGSKPSGTIGKSRTSRPSNQQLRQMKAEKVRLDRQAAAVASRATHTGKAAGDQVAIYKQANQLRAKSAKLDRTLKANAEPPHIYARGRALTGESMGKYKGQGRFSLYGKDRGKIQRDRLASTVRKPRGLQPGALTPKPKPAAKPRISNAEKTINAAKNRLRAKQYGYTANQGQALAIDRRLASQTPRQLAASRVRGARADIARTRRNLKSPLNADAPASWRQRFERRLTEQRGEFRKAAADYRLLNPKSRKRK